MTLTVPPLILRASQAALAAVVYFGLFAGVTEDAARRHGVGDVVAFLDRGTESERWVVAERREDGQYLLERIDRINGMPVVADPEEIAKAGR